MKPWAPRDPPPPVVRVSSAATADRDGARGRDRGETPNASAAEHAPRPGRVSKTAFRNGTEQPCGHGRRLSSVDGERSHPALWGRTRPRTSNARHARKRGRPLSDRRTQARGSAEASSHLRSPKRGVRVPRTLPDRRARGGAISVASDLLLRERGHSTSGVVDTPRGASQKAPNTRQSWEAQDRASPSRHCRRVLRRANRRVCTRNTQTRDLGHLVRRGRRLGPDLGCRGRSSGYDLARRGRSLDRGLVRRGRGLHTVFRRRR